MLASAQDQDRPDGGRASPFSALTGAIAVSVRWPAGSRSGQAIPVQTRQIQVAATRPDEALPVDRVVLVRIAGATESTAVFPDLVPGPLQVSAIARDASGSVLAAGAVMITVKPNEIADARLSMDEAFRPAVISLTPERAPPGGSVFVVGTDLGAAGAASLSVAVGGIRVASGDLSLTPEGFVSFLVPEAATTGPVVVSVGGVPVTSPVSFVTIASISLTPAATEAFAPNGLVRFKGRAFDTAGQDVGNPQLPLAIMARTCNPGPCAGTDELSMMDLIIGADAGNLVVVMRSGRVAASASVAVHRLTPADIPDGKPSLGPAPYPSGNPPSPARVALGKQLFFDPKLSRSGGLACATCHNPAKGWSDGRVKVGSSGFSAVARNTLSLVDAAYQSKFFWEGRAESLEAATAEELLNPGGMNAMVGLLESYLAATYGASFEASFENAPTVDLAAAALAAFIRTLLSPATTAFDRWAAGEPEALVPEALTGLGTFLGKAQCANCHSGALFSDGKFHNIGIPGSGTADFGRILLSGESKDLGAFRTSGLRNVALTAPYFHDGSSATLEAAIKHYTTFDQAFPNLSTLMPAIRVSGQDVVDLEAFLRTLTATPSY